MTYYENKAWIEKNEKRKREEQRRIRISIEKRNNKRMKNNRKKYIKNIKKISFALVLVGIGVVSSYALYEWIAGTLII